MVTLEENSLQGGFGSAVLELLAERGLSDVKILRIGIGDEFIAQGSRSEIMAQLGLDADSVARRVRREFLARS